MQGGACPPLELGSIIRKSGQPGWLSWDSSIPVLLVPKLSQPCLWQCPARRGGKKSGREEGDGADGRLSVHMGRAVRGSGSDGGAMNLGHL